LTLLDLQSLIEKHFPAPDRNRIQQMLARQGLGDTKPKSLLDELGIVVPSSNGGSSSASSSTRDSLGKRKANRQAAQKFKKKAKVSSDDDSDSSNNEDHGSGQPLFF